MMTHFSWTIDGGIVVLYLVVTMIAGLMVRKYVGKVEHFLVAGREVNVFLGIASLAATEFGVITCMYTAEAGYKYGFAGATVGILNAIMMLLVGATGFCIKPLRQAGVVTIPELFEKRFGPRIRWAAGVVIVLGGLLNMGVFLRITGEFLVLVCGFNLANLYVNILVVMTALLVLGTIYTVVGGMLSVLVTDFLQFLVMSIGLIAVTILVLVNVGWERLVHTVTDKCAAGGFNPFLNSAQGGWLFVLFNSLLSLAVVVTWQTMISRLLAAKSAKTGQQIYTRTSFFFVCRWLIPGIWGIAALAVLPAATLGTLPIKELQGKASLYAMPLFLSGFVPVGLMGLLLAAMLAADMSCTSSYMITWGSVIYNDILAPFRKTQWSDKRGLLWNRAIVAAIGVFLLVFGLLYQLKGDAWSYLAVTGTIYLASMSTLLVACCYWKRANNWGAAGAIILGAVIPLTFLVMQVAPDLATVAQRIGLDYSGVATFAAIMAVMAELIGPNYSGILTFYCTAAAMIVGSLLKPVETNRATAELPAATKGGES
jgi:solute:Na+ symporter, SSS family